MWQLEAAATQVVGPVVPCLTQDEVEQWLFYRPYPTPKAFIMLCFSPGRDKPLMIPLHYILGTHAVCKDVCLSLFPLLIWRLVSQRYPSKQWVCKEVSVAVQPVNSNALPDIHSTHVSSSLHCSPIFPVLHHHPTTPFLQYFAQWMLQISLLYL